MSETSVRCKECGSNNWVRVYPNEKIEEYDELTQFNLAKEVKCVDCGYHWSLSVKEILIHFAYLRKKEGKSKNEIIDETSKKLEEITINHFIELGKNMKENKDNV